MMVQSFVGREHSEDSRAVSSTQTACSSCSSAHVAFPSLMWPPETDRGFLLLSSKCPERCIVQCKEGTHKY
jgi:hypothetical protein